MANELSFWHPVGAHAGEDLKSILHRKQLEIDEFGFTLWSFAAAKLDRVLTWRTILKSNNQQEALVFCSGRSAKDPIKYGNEPYWCKEYSYDTINWRDLPSNHMVSYHKGPGKDGICASAFVVKEIMTSIIKINKPNRYFRSSDNSWVNDTLPTRGQYLIERPIDGEMDTKCVLKICSDFVVWVR